MIGKCCLQGYWHELLAGNGHEMNAGNGHKMNAGKMDTSLPQKKKGMVWTCYYMSEYEHAPSGCVAGTMVSWSNHVLDIALILQDTKMFFQDTRMFSQGSLRI
jgi:hypothetical protein